MTNTPVISDAVVEAACEANWALSPFKWPCSFNDKYREECRRRMRAAIQAAVLAEREECARVAEERRPMVDVQGIMKLGFLQGGLEIAAAIRARSTGETK